MKKVILAAGTIIPVTCRKRVMYILNRKLYVLQVFTIPVPLYTCYRHYFDSVLSVFVARSLIAIQCTTSHSRSISTIYVAIFLDTTTPAEVTIKILVDEHQLMFDCST